MSGIEELLGLGAMASGAAAGTAGAGAGASALALPAATTSLGLAAEEGAGLSAMSGMGAGAFGAPSMASSGSILKTLGLDTPQTLTSGLSGGVDLMLKNRQLQIEAGRNRQAYPVPPGIHSGTAVPVKVGVPLARKMSPLEEFSLLMRGRG